MGKEQEYRLILYQKVLNEYASDIFRNPYKYSKVANLKKLNTKYAKRCLAIDNATIDIEEPENEEADDL